MIINNKKITNRFMVLLLIAIILFNAFFVTVQTAEASLTLTAGTLAVLCSVLVASGFVFQNADELSKAAHSLWASLSEAQQNFFVSTGLKYLDYASSTEPFIVKLSKDICSAIGSWVGSLGATVDAPSISIPSAGGITNPLVMRGLPKSAAITAGSFLYKEDGLTDKIREKGVIVGYVAESPVYLWLKFGGTYYDYYLWFSAFVGRNVLGFDDYYINKNDFNLGYVGFRNSQSETSCRFGADASLSVTFNAEYGKPYLLLNSSGVVREGYSTSSGNGKSLQPFAEFVLTNGQSGAVSIPWTGGYAPGYGGEKELDDLTGIVVPGKLIHDGAIDSDFVGTLTPDAVRDVSTDVAGDGILDWVKSIANTIANFFDVSEFTLDFSPFEIGLSKVFPFCIPFDFYNGIKLFSSKADNFSFDIKLDTEYFKIDHTVDLTPFRIPILFFRYIVVFWFSWILISRTRDLMKW